MLTLVIHDSSTTCFQNSHHLERSIWNLHALSSNLVANVKGEEIGEGGHRPLTRTHRESWANVEIKDRDGHLIWSEWRRLALLGVVRLQNVLQPELGFLSRVDPRDIFSVTHLSCALIWISRQSRPSQQWILLLADDIICSTEKY